MSMEEEFKRLVQADPRDQKSRDLLYFERLRKLQAQVDKGKNIIHHKIDLFK